MKFAPNGQFDVEAFRYATDITITAQEILVDFAGYPTESISRNSHDYRPLGLGYANLGALLMASGLPYDSDSGRDYAACITAIMCGEAYRQSSVIAEQCPPLAPASELMTLNAGMITGGACPGYYYNREPFLDVIRMHRASVNKIGDAYRRPPVDRTRLPHSLPKPRSSLSSRPPRPFGTKPSLTARSSDTATLRSPCSRPLAPSAS